MIPAFAHLLFERKERSRILQRILYVGLIAVGVWLLGRAPWVVGTIVIAAGGWKLLTPWLPSRVNAAVQNAACARRTGPAS